MVEMRDIIRMTRIINTALMVYVISMIGFYKHYGVTYMVYHSIPTLVVYVLLYFVIHKDRIHIYVSGVYAVITVYMMAATICLGYTYGFHLYCMSLIPLSFYMEYFAHKLNTKKASAMLTSLILIVAYVICTVYSVVKGPVYEINSKIASLIMVLNAACVFCFLIVYSSMMHNMVLDSDNKLSAMAHTDQLTGLFNRHYMVSHLSARQEAMESQWVAIADIDNFKAINDKYGHNGGDYILIELAKIMQEVCKGCTVSRWGGEEFLIATDGSAQEINVLEKLRRTVEDTKFTYCDRNIDVTITVGVSYYQAGQSLDSWIQDADNKLYEGKNSGKNRVVS